MIARILEQTIQEKLGQGKATDGSNPNCSYFTFRIVLSLGLLGKKNKYKGNMKK